MMLAMWNIPWWVSGGAVWIVSVAIAGWIAARLKFHFDRKLPAQQPMVTKIRCSATYCTDLLTPGVGEAKQDLEMRLGGTKLENPAMICYRLESTGNRAAKNVNVVLRAMEADRILHWRFYSERDLVCQRYKLVEETPASLRFTCEFFNPGDSVALVLLVAPCRDAKCVSMEIDAVDLTVQMDAMQMDCRSGPLSVSPNRPR